jgi:hypothetical protein
MPNVGHSVNKVIFCSTGLLPEPFVDRMECISLFDIGRTLCRSQLAVGMPVGGKPGWTCISDDVNSIQETSLNESRCASDTDC